MRFVNVHHVVRVFAILFVQENGNFDDQRHISLAFPCYHVSRFVPEEKGGEKL